MMVIFTISRIKSYCWTSIDCFMDNGLLFDLLFPSKHSLQILAIKYLYHKNKSNQSDYAT